MEGESFPTMISAGCALSRVTRLCTRVGLKHCRLHRPLPAYRTLSIYIAALTPQDYPTRRMISATFDPSRSA